eukprot:m.472200 g.472200  ORF g.472200 m.472200 type:complete len:76 (+) comp32256_c0_seq1:137-364(+)
MCSEWNGWSIFLLISTIIGLIDFGLDKALADVVGNNGFTGLTALMVVADLIAQFVSRNLDFVMEREDLELFERAY